MIRNLHQISLRRNNSRRIPLAEHAACAAEKKNVCRILVRDIGKGDHLKDQSVDGRMLLIWIFSI
jgi:hypothetical protein